MNTFRTFLIIAFIPFILSCTQDKSKAVSEGVIEYDAKVVDENHPMAGLAPGSMTVKFKKNKVAAQMSTMGVFTSTFIADPVKKQFITLVKVFQDKTACVENEVDVNENLKEYKLKLEPTDETKEIAGYNCKKVVAHYENNPSEKFEVFYTDEMDFKMGNFASPYVGLEGMLMQYRLKKFGLEMIFTAKSVSVEKVPDETFELPGFYKVISKKEMNEFFENLN